MSARPTRTTSATLVNPNMHSGKVRSWIVESKSRLNRKTLGTLSTLAGMSRWQDNPNRDPTETQNAPRAWFD